MNHEMAWRLACKVTCMQGADSMPLLLSALCLMLDWGSGRPEGPLV
jgi:hypothetical protein